MAKELDSCPFCQSLDISLENFGVGRHRGFHGHCNDCGADGPIGDDSDEASDRWNTRYDKKKRGDGHGPRRG
ncbi:Lar family restriction alleviation protein [Mesorhizobium sp. M0189]|uniref:Lar family restriction alleviation protein n=1 Tax=Mesorhizobium sp. M0189 TaxID=2956909 RepID=UPI00333A31B1